MFRLYSSNRNTNNL